MPVHQGKAMTWKFPIEDVEVGTAHAAGLHTDEYLARLRARARYDVHRQRLPGTMLPHCSHFQHWQLRSSGPTPAPTRSRWLNGFRCGVGSKPGPFRASPASDAPDNNSEPKR